MEQSTSYLDPRLTVQELVQYVADLTIPVKYGSQERELRIQHVLKMMDIVHIQKSRIGGEGVEGIRGGERKRLAVALERYRSFARSFSYYLALLLIQIPVWFISFLLAMIVQYYVVGLSYKPFTALLIYLRFYVIITVQGLVMGVAISACTSNI